MILNNLCSKLICVNTHINFMIWAATNTHMLSIVELMASVIDILKLWFLRLGRWVVALHSVYLIKKKSIEKKLINKCGFGMATKDFFRKQKSLIFHRHNNIITNVFEMNNLLTLPSPISSAFFFFIRVNCEIIEIIKNCLQKLRYRDETMIHQDYLRLGSY
jgi:hypothetical protein